MKPPCRLRTALLALTTLARTVRAGDPLSINTVPAVIIGTGTEPVAAGKFQPTWESLKQDRVPEWFRDAKFGIWAHGGPQCEPEQGDWSARNMSIEGNAVNQYRVAMANHHDNMDLWDSKYQPWNSVKVGPQKDLIGGWAKAARRRCRAILIV
jgi:alpha-L-fucosidase